MVINMKTSRAYEMRARAEQTEQTRRRILDAAAAVAAEKPILSVALPDIAARAGVSVQTVLRQFGSRDALFDATSEHVRADVVAELEAPPGDLDAITEVLMAHYELRGDDVLMLLGQERWEPRAAEITDEGRRMHLAWVQKVFSATTPTIARWSSTSSWSPPTSTPGRSSAGTAASASRRQRGAFAA